MEKLYITSVIKNIYTSKGEDLYLYENEDVAEAAAERADERNSEEWREYKERNTWYSPEKGTHFIAPGEDDPEPDYSEYATWNYEAVDFNDGRVKALLEKDMCLVSPESKEYLEEYFKTYATKQELLNNAGFLKSALNDALSENAKPLEIVDFTRENYNSLFPEPRIETPVERVSLDEHQFEKLGADERRLLLKGVFDALKTPDIVIAEERKTVFGDEKTSRIYVKSFEFNAGGKAVCPVAVATEGGNVSISAQQMDIGNIVDKIKMPGQLIYLSDETRQKIESRTVCRTIEKENVSPAQDYDNSVSDRNDGKETSAEDAGGRMHMEIAGKASELSGSFNEFDSGQDSPSVWNYYKKSVRHILSKEDICDSRKLLAASKAALGFLSKEAMSIINGELRRRGANNEAALARTIKEAVFPEAVKNKAKIKSKSGDYGISR